MVRSDYNYAQTVIGSCGHLCEGWPAVYRLGEDIPWVPCTDCTAEQVPDWPAGETPAVWVRATGKEERKQKAKARKAKESAKPKPARKVMPWEQYLPK